MSLWKGRQKMLEALGKADATHSDSILALDRMRKLLNDGAKNVHHRVDAAVKANEAAVVHGKAMGESFHSFSGTTNQFSELAALGRALQQLGEFMAQVEEVQQTFDTDLVRQVQVPLDMQLRELQRAKAAKKAFEKARLDYDTAGTKSKNVKQEKITQGEQELQLTKQAMEAAGQSAAQQLVETNAVAEQELIARCCTLVDTHRAFYERGLKICASYNAALVEFRSHVERRQQEVEINKSKAKNTMIKELHAATTGVRDAYFGLPLGVLLEKEGSTVPKMLLSAFAYLREACLDEEGLFRVSCAKHRMVEVVQQLDNGQLPEWGAIEADGALVADVIKHFFRELPEPLLTNRLYSEFLQANNISDEKEKLAEFSRLIEALPAENRATTAELCHFLSEVAVHSSKNKMGPANLATIFGPSLLSPQTYSPTNMGEEIALANLSLVLLITKHDVLFGPSRAMSPARTRATALPTMPRPSSPRPGAQGPSSPRQISPSPRSISPGPAPLPSVPPQPTTPTTPTTSSSMTTPSKPVPRPPGSFVPATPSPTAPVGSPASSRTGWRSAAPPSAQSDERQNNPP